MKKLDKGFKTSSKCFSFPTVCVAVKRTKGGVLVKDTKTEEVLSFSNDEFSAFIAGVKDGEFDV